LIEKLVQYLISTLVPNWERQLIENFVQLYSI
jgi:hypothetical protein